MSRDEQLVDDQVGALLLKALTRAEDLAQADGEISRALELAPDSAEAWFVRGELFFKHQRLELAVGYFNKACALEPANQNYEAALDRARGQQQAAGQTVKHPSTGEDPGDEEPALPKVMVTPEDELEPPLLEGDMEVDLIRLRTQVDERPLAEILAAAEQEVAPGWAADPEMKTRVMEQSAGAKTLKMNSVPDGAELMETLRDESGDVSSMVRHALRTVELNTGELDVVEELVVTQDQELDLTADEAARAAAETAREEPIEVGDDNKLANETRVLLDAIEQGEAGSVLVICMGPRDERPRIPRSELALVKVRAYLSQAFKIIDSAEAYDGEAGLQLQQLHRKYRS